MVNDVKPGGVFLINCQWDAAELAEKMNAETKRYIAKNNVQLYTVNAIDIAAEIGLGKRTNTVLKSAFFAMSNVLTVEDAIGYIKEKAQKFMKKGKEIVEMNEKAIDAGAITATDGTMTMNVLVEADAIQAEGFADAAAARAAFK